MDRDTPRNVAMMLRLMILPFPTPTPTALQVITIDHPETTGIIRRFRTDDARRCKLCRTCRRLDGPDGQSVCYVEAIGRIDGPSAALFSA